MNEKILIVEDEFVVANDLQLTLEKAGYNVCGIAASVQEAKELIKEEKPSLVVLDIHLKESLSGIDLAKELRESNIGFIFLSANSNQQTLEAAKSTEPYGFLVKPYREKRPPDNPRHCPVSAGIRPGIQDQTGKLPVSSIERYHP